MARVKMLVFAVSVFALTVMNFELPYLPADRLHAKLSIGFHGKKLLRSRQSEVLNQQQLMCIKSSLFLTIYTNVEMFKQLTGTFLLTFYIQSKSKASLCALCTNTSEMNRNTAVYQN